MESVRGETTLRVLVVEDDEDDYLVMQRMLRRAFGDAATLTWVDRYAVALSVMQPGTHDLYLIDYRLGAYNGVDLLHVLRQRGDTTPAILLTGIDDYGVDVLATAAGAADYLLKTHLNASFLERSIRYALYHAQVLDTVQASERRFRALIEHGSDGIALLGSDYTIRYASPSTTRILGYTPEEFVQCGLFDLIHPDDRAVVARRIAEGSNIGGDDTDARVADAPQGRHVPLARIHRYVTPR